MIDTHCHIFSEYYDDISSLINDIKANGVKMIIVNGCDMKSNLEVLSLIKQYDMVYGAIGFHPTEEVTDVDEAIEFLKQHVGDDKIVAIGEIGLDYHYENTDILWQKELFKRQLDVAMLYNKPVIVHTRDAIKDTFDILSTYHLKGSIHAYSGSLEMAREFVKLGYMLGIGGVATYKNAKNIIQVIENIDLAYILLETDSPYLAPVPLRGTTNTPSNIPIIAKKISELKNIELSEVSKITTENAERLFDF